MKKIRWLLGLAMLLIGLVGGKWISGEAVAQAEALCAWKQQDVEGCFKALTWLAQTSPARAFELLLTLEGDETRQKDLLQRLTKEFPDAGTELMAVFLRHPEFHHDYTMGDTVFCECARADPERAWDAMMAHSVQFMPAYLPAIARGIAQREPREAMGYAAKIKDPMQRESFVDELMKEWSTRDGQDLLTWLRAQPDAHALARHVGWFQLKITDASRLADIAALMPEAMMTDNFSFRSGRQRPAAEGAWIQHTDWLLALPAGDERGRLCAAAARGLVQLDPEAALKLLPEIKNAAIHQLVTSTVSAYRAAKSPKDGLAFANALTDAEARRKAKNSVFSTWAENDPAGAARHAVESGDPDAKILLSFAGSRWAMADPENACRFALEHEPPGDGKTIRKNDMLKTAVNIWAGKEPVAATRWVKALPEGEAKDAAISAAARALAFRLPEEGLRWAQEIKDAETRRQALDLCFRSWLYKDQDRPKQWLQQTSLDEATRKSLDTLLKHAVEAHQPGSAKGGAIYASDATMIFP